MTLEGQGPGEDQTPAPPARTRWSQDDTDDADVLLPPYVPGRPAPKAGAQAGQAPSADGAEAQPAASSGGGESDESWAESETPGTFAAPEPEAVAGTVEPERAASVEPEAEPEPATASGGASGDYPWDAAGADGAAEAERETVPVAEPEARKHADPWPPEEPEGEDAFPFAAFDIEGPPDDAAVGERAEPEGMQEPEESFAPGSSSSGVTAGADAMAERVERLAEALRREGRPGVEREIGSEDRLTSLLAGVLAGYLAGRED